MAPGEGTVIARRAGRVTLVTVLAVLAILAGLIAGFFGLLYVLQLYTFFNPTR